MSSEVKQDVGKRRLDLLPWDALDLVGDVLTYGINKYPTPKENWRVNSTQEDIGRYRAALLRHLSAKAQGEAVDPESGLLHDAHIATNALFILALEKKYSQPVEAELLPAKLNMSETAVKVLKKVPVCSPNDSIPF